MSGLYIVTAMAASFQILSISSFINPDIHYCLSLDTDDIIEYPAIKQIVIFGVMTPCRLIDGYQHFFTFKKGDEIQRLKRLICHNVK
jgi:hypothetical protein